VCTWCIDTAYSCDPRIKRFKEEERSRKESERKGRAEAKKKEQEEKDRVSSHNPPGRRGLNRLCLVSDYYVESLNWF